LKFALLTKKIKLLQCGAICMKYAVVVEFEQKKYSFKVKNVGIRVF
jgi:hypothetical protein